MKASWNPRTLFPPYQLAAAGMWIHLIFAAAGILLLVTGRGTLVVVLALLASAIAGLLAHWGATCPACGKPVMQFYLTHWGERRWGEPFGSRLWPERECSSCRTPLDIL